MVENVTQCSHHDSEEQDGDLVALVDAFNQWMNSLEVNIRAPNQTVAVMI